MVRRLVLVSTRQPVEDWQLKQEKTTAKDCHSFDQGEISLCCLMIEINVSVVWFTASFAGLPIKLFIKACSTSRETHHQL